MRRGPAVAAAAALLLAGCLAAGCGSASHPGAPGQREPREPDFTRVASVCGTLDSRLRGIATLHQIGDPQPAKRGRLPAVRVWRASVQAALASHATVPQLRAIGAPAPSITAVTLAERSYARYADVAKSSFARTAEQGLRIELGYLKLIRAEIAGCIGPAQGS